MLKRILVRILLVGVLAVLSGFVSPTLSGLVIVAGVIWIFIGLFG